VLVAGLALMFALPAAAGACGVTVPVGASVESAVNSAAPGAVVCLRGGVHTDPDREFRITARGTGEVGAGAKRIVVRSFPGELATLYGRLWVTPEAAWVTFARLLLDGSGGPLQNRTSAETLPSPTVPATRSCSAS
jgi:hypothetical protein